MNKTWLIIQREFLTRVKKKSFIVMTILGPLLFAGVFIIPIALSQMPEGPKEIVVLDETGILWISTKQSDDYKTILLPPNELSLEEALDFLKKNEHDALLYIPSAEDPNFIAQHCKLYGIEDVSLKLQSHIEKSLGIVLQEEMFKLQNIDPVLVAQSRVNVSLRPINLAKSEEAGEEKNSSTGVNMAVGYISGFAIYLFIFLYGSQVMRGVIEEKTSRIVEVIISSVKPFQLMMGKIIGICGVGLFQFLIWVVLSMLITSVAGSIFFDQSLSPEAIAAAQLSNTDLSAGQEIMENFMDIPFGLIIPAFAFFFIGGYLLYGSFFAAIGSAVDSETDTQQFMLPVALPLILGIIVSSTVLEDPNSPIAFWFSIFPLTSPIVMMVRLPFIGFGWDLVISMVLLIVFFIFSTWMAGKIYRVGILMYGKKASYKELLKWMRYKN